jgi:hypothetical protein
VNLRHCPTAGRTPCRVNDDDRIPDPTAAKSERVGALRAGRGVLADSLEGRNRPAVFDTTVSACVEDMEIACLKARDGSACPIVHGHDECDVRTYSRLPMPARCCSHEPTRPSVFLPPSRCQAAIVTAVTSAVSGSRVFRAMAERRLAHGTLEAKVEVGAGSWESVLGVRSNASSPLSLPPDGDPSEPAEAAINGDLLEPVPVGRARSSPILYRVRGGAAGPLRADQRPISA